MWHSLHSRALPVVVFSIKLDLEVLEIFSLVHNTLYVYMCTNLISLKEICSAGSKDGCIKLWKISKNYTVLQPLYSIPMVGRFQVIFTYKKISCADPKNFQGWVGGESWEISVKLFETEGDPRVFIRYKNYYVNLINLSIGDGEVLGKGVSEHYLPPLPCTSAHRNMITFLRLWFFFLYM